MRNVSIAFVATVLLLSTATCWSQKATLPQQATIPASAPQQQVDTFIGSIHLLDKAKSPIQTYNIAFETSFSFSKKTTIDKFVKLLEENDKKLLFRTEGKTYQIAATSATTFTDAPGNGRSGKGAKSSEQTIYCGDRYQYRATGQIQADKIVIIALEALGRKPPDPKPVKK